MMHRQFEVTANGDGFELADYLRREVGKVLCFRAFGFPAGSTIFLAASIRSCSKFGVSGVLTFDVNDPLGKAAFVISGFRWLWGFQGRSILDQAREFTSFDRFSSIDWEN